MPVWNQVPNRLQCPVDLQSESARCKMRAVFLTAGILYRAGAEIKKIQSRSKCSISIKIFNLDRKFQSRRLHFPTKIRNNREGGTASLRSRTCVKRNAVFGARFRGLSLYSLYKKGKLIPIKTGLDTYLIQTRTPLSRYPLMIILKDRAAFESFILARNFQSR